MNAIGVFAATRWEVEAVRQAFSVTEMRLIGTVRCLIARQRHLDWWIIPMGVGPGTGRGYRANGARENKRLPRYGPRGLPAHCAQPNIGDVLMGTLRDHVG